MSLLVWLPLDGDLHNQGCNDVTVTVTGTTAFAAGKIGQGLTCNGSSFWTISNITLGTSATIACWVKTTTNGKMSWVLRSNASNVLNLYQSSNYTLNTGDGNTNLFQDNSNNSIACLHDGQWHHQVVVWDTDVAKLYIDGIYRGTAKTFRNPTTTNKTICLGGGYNGGHTYDWNGMLNDFRIYDHALSSKEIRKLSQALMLHYKMNYLPIDNIIYDDSGYGHFGTFLGAPTLDANGPFRYKQSFSFDGTDDGIKIDNLDLNPIINNSVTYSFWIKPTNENGARSVYFGSYSGASWSIEKTTGNALRSYWNGSPDTTLSTVSIVDGIWQHICIVKTGSTNLQVYVNGVKKADSNINLSSKTFATTYRIARDTRSGDGTPYHGNMSDFRIYATALSEEDIKELYEVSASIDNKQNFYAYEFIENTSNQELLAQWNSSGYSNHTNTGKWSSYNAEGEWYLHGASTSLGTTFTPVSPTGKTYYYDMTLSVSAGNQAYVGISRFDANKGSAANEGCVYIYSTKPTSDIIKQRFFGTVNLGTTANGSNPLAYITLRVLNGWSGSIDAANAEMTIHNISLREVDTATGITTASIIKTGVASSDSIREYDGNARITKNGFIEANELIEI